MLNGGLWTMHSKMMWWCWLIVYSVTENLLHAMKVYLLCQGLLPYNIFILYRAFGMGSWDHLNFLPFIFILYRTFGVVHGDYWDFLPFLFILYRTFGMGSWDHLDFLPFIFILYKRTFWCGSCGLFGLFFSFTGIHD